LRIHKHESFVTGVSVWTILFAQNDSNWLVLFINLRIQFRIKSPFQTDKRALKFWTSGANEKCGAQSTYAWCTLGEVVPSGLLTNYTKTSTSLKDRCLLFDAAGKDNKSVLAHSDCSIKIPYICEATCKEPTYPSSLVWKMYVPLKIAIFWFFNLIIYLKESLFNAEGKIASMNAFKKYIEL